MIPVLQPIICSTVHNLSFMEVIIKNSFFSCSFGDVVINSHVAFRFRTVCI